MNKKDMIIRGGSVVLVIVLLILWGRAGTKAPEEKAVVVEETETSESINTQETSSYPIDVLNATYTIDDRSIRLIDGVSSMPASIDSETIMKVSVLNGPAFADIDGDGMKDAVVILRDEPGGTGVFYYASVLLSGNGNQASTNAVLLGDRIRIQSIEILAGGNVVIQTLERAITDSMATPPSVQTTKSFVVSGATLAEVK